MEFKRLSWKENKLTKNRSIPNFKSHNFILYKTYISNTTKINK